jgi:hypothetical protein
MPQRLVNHVMAHALNVLDLQKINVQAVNQESIYIPKITTLSVATKTVKNVLDLLKINARTVKILSDYTKTATVYAPKENANSLTSLVKLNKLSANHQVYSFFY